MFRYADIVNDQQRLTESGAPVYGKEAQESTVNARCQVHFAGD